MKPKKVGSGLEVTEIRIKLSSDPRQKLRAYCSVTLGDAFVVRDLKIIEGARGPFVAMPSRKLADNCPRCRAKNHLRANYCNQCGSKLDQDRAPRDGRGRARLHADLAHPINSATRVEIHRLVVMAFAEEVERSEKAGYQPPTFDDLDDLSDFVDEEYLDELSRRQDERSRRRDQDSGSTDARATDAGAGEGEAGAGEGA